MRLIRVVSARMSTLQLVGALSIVAFTVPASATPGSGTTQIVPAARAKITGPFGSHQWGDLPLFNLLLQSSPGDWGYDLVQVIAEFAAMNTNGGKPSTSGWHSHTSTAAIIQVVQGTLWVQEKENPGCLTPIKAGTVFLEGPGHIHNAFNIDPQVSAVVRIVYFIERSVPATTVSEPDPITHDINVATAPPAAICVDPNLRLDGQQTKNSPR